MSRQVRHTLLLFALLGMVFIPYPFHLLPVQSQVAHFLFGGLLNTLTGSSASPAITSDTIWMYLLVLVLFVLSITLSFLARFIKAEYLPKIEALVLSLCAWYLSLQLMKYGMDKVLKTQFYLPEPNILYTPFGMLDQDILYWSTIGTSRSYNLFLGIIELLAAGLLLFKRTRLMGALAAWLLMINVVMVNFSFDISVKLFSLFLLFLSLMVLLPHARYLWKALLHRPLPLTSQQPVTVITHPFWRATLKTGVAGVLILESAYALVMYGVANGDATPRPALHGAYETMQVSGGAPGDFIRFENVKRLFVHRKGYLILQYQNDRMKDYKLTVNDAERITLTNYEGRHMTLSYAAHDSVLSLIYPPAVGAYSISTKALNWKKLPALQSRFHWMSDGE